MNNIAVIDLAGSQHIVKVGDKLKVNKLNFSVGEEFTPIVLMSTSHEEVLINQGQVKLKLLEHTKGKKMTIIKFRAKSRYRRKKGHRQHLSVVQVVSINDEILSNESLEQKNGDREK